MKKIYFIVLTFFALSANAQVIAIPDANFKAKLVGANPSNWTAKNFSDQFMTIDTNANGEIEMSEAAQVAYLKVDFSSISSLEGLSGFVNLETFFCGNNPIPNLNDYLQGMTSLKRLYCGHNGYTTLNLTTLTNLEWAYCGDLAMTSLQVSGLSHLEQLDCRYSPIASIDLSGLNALKIFECSFCSLTSLNLNGLLALEDLWCDSNPIASLSVSGLPNLFRICAMNDQLTSVNLNNLPALTILDVSNNHLQNIDLNALTALTRIGCGQNLLTSLNVSALTQLELLNFESNSIANISLDALTQLKYLYCDNNPLVALDVTASPLLGDLRFSNTMLTTIDVRNQPELYYLICDNNPQLRSIFIKNGSSQQLVNFANNPNLEYICADEPELAAINEKITTYGYTNCTANSYCTFVPGGNFYTIQGNARFDSDSNGCDVADVAFQRLKFNISNGSSSVHSIADETGAFFIPVAAGNYTIAPILENPEYFTVSPTQVNVAFPAVDSVVQDFCISPIGSHSDLEITILPITAARPGFDSTYKIIYKNKGNQSQSGGLAFAFNDAVLDFVSAQPAFSSNIMNYLNWNFTDLQPMERREIYITLNANSPMETPPLTGGFTLNFTASITSVATDEVTADNTFTLNQLVVNSFDPNDKTCLEGNTISPEMAGEEVHYLIRFENTGTANAQNIVVKDYIDTDKFDIATLIPMDASHSFVTRISEGNKVEFIFENIDLPFDDAHNDGFILFKIKTKPTLGVGDMLSNTASIYFDYNFPIVTNPAVTTITTLGKQDFEFDDYFRIYPNPAKALLQIDSKENTAIHSISIYNTLGQLVLSIPNARQRKAIDVSGLKSGNYLIRIYSEKGQSNAKFIKL